MNRAANLLLRLALAFAFLYPAYGLWKHPADWLGYVPDFVRNIGLSEHALLLSLAAFHLALALWLLSGWRVRAPAVLGAAALGVIVYFNLNELDVLFRDVSLALAALALAFTPRGY